MDRGAWQATVHGVAKSQTWTEELSLSSILAWEISWTEEPGGLQSTGSQRVRHNGATSLSRPASGQRNLRGEGQGGGHLSSEARVHPPHPPPTLQERMGVGICPATPSKPRPRWAPGPGWEEHTGFQDQSRHREHPSQ